MEQLLPKAARPTWPDALDDIPDDQLSELLCVVWSIPGEPSKVLAGIGHGHPLAESRGCPVATTDAGLSVTCASSQCRSELPVLHTCESHTVSRLVVEHKGLVCSMRCEWVRHAACKCVSYAIACILSGTFVFKELCARAIVYKQLSTLFLPSPTLRTNKPWVTPPIACAL